MTFLGFRVLPGALRLSVRRRQAGLASARTLQAGYDAALAITAHADARGWRRAQLVRRPPVDA